MSERETDDIPITMIIEMRKVKGRFDTCHLEKKVLIQRGEAKIEFKDTENINKIEEKMYKERLIEIRKILEVFKTSELDSTRIELLKEAMIKILDLIYIDLELKNLR